MYRSSIENLLSPGWTGNSGQSKFWRVPCIDSKLSHEKFQVNLDDYFLCLSTS